MSATNANKKETTEIIRRFYIPGEEGYSECWRRDKSTVESIELANLLRGIRKITSYVGNNIGDIVWSGMKHTGGIALDPKFLMGKYPVPASKTDIAVGMAIHNGFQITEWSDRFKGMALKSLDLPPVYAYKLNLYLNMCEKVYADLLSNRTILGLYTEKAREWTLNHKNNEFMNRPTVTELLHIWWKIAADRNENGKPLDEKNHPEAGRLRESYMGPITLLNSILDRLKNECPNISGVSQRGEFRISLYLSIWDELLAYIKFWPGDTDDPFLFHDEFDRDRATDNDKKKTVNLTIPDFAKEIEKHLISGNIDYTEKVKSIVKNVNDVVRIEQNNIVMPAKNRIDNVLLQKLRLVIKAASKKTKLYNRGLRSGKIDQRRLYRAPTTGKTFQLKNEQFELANNISLLVDCTGSMSGPAKWAKNEIVYQTLFSAIYTYNKNARIFGYNEVKEICRITELYKNDKFYMILPHGKTASGEAIIATALNLKKKTKSPFILHITDGASNWGCGVSDAVKFCGKHNIKLLTLGLECNPSNKQALRKEYGQLVQFVDDINELPDMFKKLLIRAHPFRK